MIRELNLLWWFWHQSAATRHSSDSTCHHFTILSNFTLSFTHRHTHTQVSSPFFCSVFLLLPFHCWLPWWFIDRHCGFSLFLSLLLFLRKIYLCVLSCYILKFVFCFECSHSSESRLRACDEKPSIVRCQENSAPALKPGRKNTKLIVFQVDHRDRTHSQMDPVLFWFWKMSTEKKIGVID